MTNVQYRLLRQFFPRSPGDHRDGNSNRSKLDLLGRSYVERLVGKTVIDFGCGEGSQAVEMARIGAARVIGIDIRESVLEVARQKAKSAGVLDRCEFVTSTAEKADAIVSIDAFEHFEDPAAILQTMYSLLKPGGECLISFGPTWGHPLGGHLFSVFPWAHLLLSEQALIRWRSDFKTDGATRFSEVEGGLNQMTIGRFEKLVREQKFTIVELQPVPIRSLRLLHNGITREFTTAIVRCRLSKPQ